MTRVTLLRKHGELTDETCGKVLQKKAHQKLLTVRLYTYTMVSIREVKNYDTRKD